jgi:hypothetical protein
VPYQVHVVVNQRVLHQADHHRLSSHCNRDGTSQATFLKVAPETPDTRVGMSEDSSIITTKSFLHINLYPANPISILNLLSPKLQPCPPPVHLEIQRKKKFQTSPELNCPLSTVNRAATDTLSTYTSCRASIVTSFLPDHQEPPRPVSQRAT